MSPLLARLLQKAGEEILRASRKPLAALMRKRASKLRSKDSKPDTTGQA